jgi:hypothetical protein
MYIPVSHTLYMLTAHTMFWLKYFKVPSSIQETHTQIEFE